MPTKEEIAREVKTLGPMDTVKRTTLLIAGGKDFADLEALCGPKSAVAIAESPNLKDLLEKTNKITATDQTRKVSQIFGDELCGRPEAVEGLEKQLKAAPDLKEKFLTLYKSNPEALAEALPGMIRNPATMAATVAGIPVQPMAATAPLPPAASPPAAAAEKPEVKGFADFMVALGQKAEAGNNTAKLIHDRLQRETTRDNNELHRDAARNQRGMMDANPKVLTEILDSTDKNPNIGAADFNKGWEFARARPEQMRDFVTDPQAFIRKAEMQVARDKQSTPATEGGGKKMSTDSPKEGTEKQSSEKAMLAQLTEIGLDEDKNIRPGFQEFMERVGRHPALKSALSSLSKDNKGEGFMTELKAQLDKDPNLFVTANKFMDKNPDQVGKMAREMVNDPKAAFEKLQMATGLSKMGNWFREKLTWGGIGNFIGDLVDGLPGLMDVFKPLMELFGFKGFSTVVADKKPDTPAPQATASSNPAPNAPQAAPSSAPSAAVLKAQEGAALAKANADKAKADADKAEADARGRDAGRLAQDTPSSPSTDAAPEEERNLASSPGLNGEINSTHQTPAVTPSAYNTPYDTGSARVFTANLILSPSAGYEGLDPRQGPLGSKVTLDDGRGTLKSKAWDPTMSANNDRNNITFGIPVATQPQPDQNPAVKRQMQMTWGA
jgi:hypothetical protein